MIITLSVTCAAAWAGVPALSWITGLDFSPYASMLLILMLGGGFSAAVNLLTQVLTIMRCQSAILMCYAVMAAVSLVLPRVLVQSGGIKYAGWSFLILMMLLCMMQGTAMYVLIRRKKRGELK